MFGLSLIHPWSSELLESRQKPVCAAWEEDRDCALEKVHVSVQMQSQGCKSVRMAWLKPICKSYQYGTKFAFVDERKRRAQIVETTFI